MEYNYIIIFLSTQELFISMKLYQIPKMSKIMIESSVASYVIFYHIDVAYSYCETEHGEIVHLSASTELELLESGNYATLNKPLQF